ncbi:NUDIX hydrolase [Demequina sp. SYSU T00039]|uniref:NUDIX hydrolase n=1 Tax=Demequina lignilytica TaxID=3051663 RepID=A0AAW7M1R4_9MICO|nr:MULTISPECIES: NUDIX hydrolase [unclassified Demequina]MDN4478615.1 NUDIX hydrolase [Demequina sp. SYSU T00039-1]MDN4488593.1 NUDIX hydrolase [Demequina sp. SYSU T00039]MDN4491619.1 NUDIX hydrolase [Demequina sp. SYSU T00068]
MSHYPDGTVVAAGALVWRVRNGELQVLAVHRPRYNDWSWPKGKLDPGEHLPECAVREVAEETGKQIELGQPLPTIRYPIGAGKQKVVKYWAATVLPSGSRSVKARPTYKAAAKHEIDRLRWLSVEEAHRIITFPDDLRPLDALIEAYQAGRLDTRPFVLVRHARAKRRKAWKLADLRRPITKAGAQRARAIVPLISCFGVGRVDSSPARRCVDTVAPYAAAVGVEVKTHDSLTEPSHAERPLATAKTFAKLFYKTSARAVCVHRPTLPTIIELMRASIRPYTRGALPRSNPYLPAGGVLVAHVNDTESGPVVVAVETHLLRVHV